MGLLADLGFTEATPAPSIDEAAKAMASGGLPPEGVHYAVLNGYRGIEANNGNKGHELSFEIIAGPGKGAKVGDAIWNPNPEQDDKKRGTSQRRMLVFGYRLGLITKDASGRAKDVEGKHSFADCLGQCVFIEVKHEEEEYEKDGKKRKIMKAKLTFEGVLSPDDKKCKDIPKGAVPEGAVPAAGSVAGGAGGKPKDNFSDL
jgi:hypothetical protein